MVEPTVAALPARLEALKAKVNTMGLDTSERRVVQDLIAVVEAVQVAQSECNWHDCARPCGCEPLDKALKELDEALR